MVTQVGRLGSLASLRRRFTPGSLARDITTLGASTALSQLLALLLMPIVTRLYSSADFGVFAAFVGITAVLSVFVCGRYEMAIVLPRSVRQARLLLLLSLLLAVAASGFVLFGAWGLAQALPHVEIYSDILAYSPLIAITMLALGVKAAASYWLIRTKQFRDSGMLEFGNMALIIAFQISYALIFGSGWRGLVMAMTTAQSIVALAYIARLTATGAFRYEWNKRIFIGLAALARQHAQLPLFSMPASLMNTAGYQSLVILMPLYFSTSVIGHLALTMRTVRAPIQLVSGSLGNVLTQRLAHNAATGVSNVPIIVSTVRWLALASLSFVIPLLFWAPDLYALVFGEQWREAGTYAVLLLPMVVANLCVSSTSKMFIYKKNHIGLIWQTYFAIGLIAAIVVGGTLDGPLLAVGLYSAVGTILYCIHLGLTLKFAGGSWKSVFSFR